MNRYLREELRQNNLMTLLSEKRTLLSEIRTWITMMIFPLSAWTGLYVVAKSTSSETSIFLTLGGFVVLGLIFVILVPMARDISQLVKLNKTIKKTSKHQF